MRDLIDVRTAGPVFRQWLARLYSGVEAYVGKPPTGKVRLHDLNAVYQWKVIDAARRRKEKLWEPRFAWFLEKSGREVARIYGRTRTETFLDNYFAREFTPELRKLYRALYEDVGLEFLRRVDSAVREKQTDFDRINSPYDILEFANWIDRTTGEKIVNVSRTTVVRTKEIIQEGIREGRSIYEIMETIRQDFGFSKFRGFTIARTEVISASNAATHFGVGRRYPTDGMTKAWYATMDHRTRQTHKRANRQEVPFDKPFHVGNSELMFPGDGSLGAAAKETIQCRCSALYYVSPLSITNPPGRPGTTPPPRTTPPRVPRKPRVPRTPKPKPAPKPKPLKRGGMSTDEILARAFTDPDLQKLLEEVDAINQQMDDIVRNLIETRNYYKQGRTNKLTYDITASQYQRDWAAAKKLLREKHQKATRLFRERYMWAETPGDWQFAFSWRATPRFQQRMSEMMDDWNRTIGDIPALRETKVNIRPGTRRANASGRGGKGGFSVINVSGNENRTTVFHELGHILNNTVDDLDDAVRALHLARTASDPLEKLADVSWANYDSTEVTRKDRYIDPYFGKEYSGRSDPRRNGPRELVSMTVQKFVEDPFGMMRRDPELFRVVWDGILKASGRLP